MQVVHGSTVRCPRRESSGDNDDVVAVQAQHASVEQLVMQGAESESVVEVVRAAELEPADVRCLNADDASAGGTVEAAERTVSVPSFDDRGGPRGAAGSLSGPRVGDRHSAVQEVRIEPDCY